MPTFLSRLFSRSPKRPDVYCGPAERRVYAIGDIHGRVDLLERLLGLIEQDRKQYDKPAEIVFLGDYVDRGENSKQVVDHCLAFAARTKSDPTISNAVFLKGNHEQAMLDFMDNPEKGSAWLRYGGVATIFSYLKSEAPFLPKKSDHPKLAEDLRKAVPDSHVAFLKSLKLHYKAGDYFFVHAAINPQLDIDDQPVRDMLWGNSRFLEKPWKLPYMVVHGHTIKDKPVVLPFRIGIDTGAFHSGVLTAMWIDGDQTGFLSTGAPA